MLADLLLEKKKVTKKNTQKQTNNANNKQANKRRNTILLDGLMVWVTVTSSDLMITTSATNYLAFFTRNLIGKLCAEGQKAPIDNDEKNSQTFEI